MSYVQPFNGVCVRVCVSAHVHTYMQESWGVGVREFCLNSLPLESDLVGAHMVLWARLQLSDCPHPFAGSVRPLAHCFDVAVKAILVSLIPWLEKIFLPSDYINVHLYILLESPKGLQIYILPPPWLVDFSNVIFLLSKSFLSTEYAEVFIYIYIVL